MRYLDKGALISSCSTYRYRLWRRWDDQKPVLVWIMLNPSTADGAQDDATIRTIVAFSDLWGFGGIEVVNLFAYRATDPKALKLAGYQVGPENLAHLRAVIRLHYHFVAAWGANANTAPGHAMIRRLAELWDYITTIEHKTLSALRVSPVTGMPGHPLYVPRTQERVHFDFRGLV